MTEHPEVLRVPGVRAVTRRAAVAGRAGAEELIRGLEAELGDAVAGPPFLFLEFITDVQEGLDVRVGFPVVPGTPGAETIPGMDVLERTCPSVEAAATRAALFREAYGAGLISDEFAMDLYPRWVDGDAGTVTVRFVVHAWPRLLVRALEDELGVGAAAEILDRLGSPPEKGGLEDRFRWTRRAVSVLEERLTPGGTYRVLSACAHVFPGRMLLKLREVFQGAVAEGAGELEAVDAVRGFMRSSPGWAEPPSREGSILASSKGPRDRMAFEAAHTDEERRRAACYCPLIRDLLDRGMPETFCLCGAGWMRQQWEAVLGRPLRVRVVASLLRGDPRCSFSIDLEEEVEP